jgi:hypothetical protein
MNIERNNQVLRSKTKFGFNNKYQDNMTFWFFSQWSIHHCEGTQWCGVSIKLLNSMKIHFLIHVPYWNLAIHSSFQEKFLNQFHRLKSMVKKYEVEEIIDLKIWNTSFIGKVTMWMKTHRNQLDIYRLSWKMWKKCISNIQIGPCGIHG